MDRGLLDNLKELLKERISFSESVRNNHAKGEDAYDPVLPKAVLFPNNNDELSKILKICNEYKVPVTAYGTGTSLEGHVVGNDKGFTISLENFNKIIAINEDDFDCRVQANVSREQLNENLKDKGVFFPIDPGANAALGGMAACSASGTMAVKYGTMKTVVMGLTVVLANGDIIETGTRAKKTSAGYNLTNLFVGSEGTLGVISEIQLRLNPIPESIMSAICQFEDLESAVLTAQQVIQYGIPIARIEMLNKDQMDISIKYSSLKNLEIKPTLFFEFHGSEISNKESIKVAEEISQNNNGTAFKWAQSTEERNKLWQARHDAYYAVKAQKNNIKVYVTDVCVPISRLSECIEATKKDVTEHNVLAPIVGHVGDGNFHLLIVVDPCKEKELEIVAGINDRLLKRALSMGGTITGEHGIGLGKMEYLELEHSGGLSVMRSIKNSIDPDNIMNPGKIVLP